MGISGSKPHEEWKPEPKPEKVVVPPLFDAPHNAARTRMLVPGYEQAFGKPVLRGLFEDYFDLAGSVKAGVVLKLLEDPHFDLSANMSPAGGEAQLRLQSEDNPDTFVDFLVSTSKLKMKLRSSVYSPMYGIGAFGALPLHPENSMGSEEYGILGLRYDSENLSIGATFVPSTCNSSNEVPYGAWLVGRIGGLSAGAQYKPLGGSNHRMPFEDLNNWNFAVSYGLGSTSLLSPSFNFSLELLRDTQLIASFYRHQVVQRKVKLWGEGDKITNYIDFGLELETRVDKDKPTDNADNSSLQLAANWQANKNFLIKGKLGPSKSSVALAFTSWWKPMFTFSVTAVNDHSKDTRAYGFGIHVNDLVKEPMF
ncbi:uncharacterized protein LOC100839992 isoform X3 [Brachypodium distachyon]|uniref:Uncharacterized protein n=1 Tax=Brachypodium distachyon TaxID=15368 RepID=A0A0Q3G2D5_BRADI|nr:uncharacterized protein LOC100839992 isoform X3 [Brachypodium distachyon]KQK04725.1 hypothetical protein BRADI_2g15540v3 [Brachypodium distachyon]|eukprot:XP_010230995.1 uncharacterized protein LOC100839992 isoform X3 [Brachypodium distachyon]